MTFDRAKTLPVHLYLMPDIECKDNLIYLKAYKSHRDSLEEEIKRTLGMAMIAITKLSRCGKTTT